jgi:hypothetical protein
MKNRLQKERGSLMVAAMLIILVLAGLGLIGVRNVILEHKQVGNYRAGEQALKVTDSGMTSAVALAASKGDAFPAFVQANSNHISMADTSKAYFDTTTGGSFGRNSIQDGGVNFVTTFSAPFDTNRVPGYPVSDQFIWKKYRMTTDGYFGDQLIQPGVVDDTLRNSARRYISYCYVGPFVIAGGGQ